jgi:hypothetical protein
MSNKDNLSDSTVFAISKNIMSHNDNLSESAVFVISNSILFGFAVPHEIIKINYQLQREQNLRNIIKLCFDNPEKNLFRGFGNYGFTKNSNLLNKLFLYANILDKTDNKNFSIVSSGILSGALFHPIEKIRINTQYLYNLPIYQKNNLPIYPQNNLTIRPQNKLTIYQRIFSAMPYSILHSTVNSFCAFNTYFYVYQQTESIISGLFAAYTISNIVGYPLENIRNRKMVNANIIVRDIYRGYMWNLLKLAPVSASFGLYYLLDKQSA